MRGKPRFSGNLIVQRVLSSVRPNVTDLWSGGWKCLSLEIPFQFPFFYFQILKTRVGQ